MKCVCGDRGGYSRDSDAICNLAPAKQFDLNELHTKYVRYVWRIVVTDLPNMLKFFCRQKGERQRRLHVQPLFLGRGCDRFYLFVDATNQQSIHQIYVNDQRRCRQFVLLTEPQPY